MQLRRNQGLTLLEILIVVAIVGVLSVVTFVRLPWDHFAVHEATQVTGRAVQYARFEAVRTDSSVSLTFTANSGTIVVKDSAGNELHSYDLAPKGSVVPTTTVTLTFNARGITDGFAGAALVLRHVGSGYSKTVDISAQGGVKVL